MIDHRTVPKSSYLLVPCFVAASRTKISLAPSIIKRSCLNSFIAIHTVISLQRNEIRTCSTYPIVWRRACLKKVKKIVAWRGAKRRAVRTPTGATTLAFEHPVGTTTWCDVVATNGDDTSYIHHIKSYSKIDKNE